MARLDDVEIVSSKPALAPPPHICRVETIVDVVEQTK